MKSDASTKNEIEPKIKKLKAKLSRITITNRKKTSNVEL